MKWEYHMTDPVTVPKLNELGSEGWELVTIQKTGALLKYIYKRPKK